MSSHGAREDPWRVRVDNVRGEPRGAGVLLDDRHVLACAHVVVQAGAAPGHWEDLWQLLERYRERAGRFFGAEDPLLRPLHGEALRALWDVPIDLTAARAAVNRDVDEVSRRIDNGEGDAGVADEV